MPTTRRKHARTPSLRTPDTAPTRWSFELRIRPDGDAGGRPAFRVHLLSSPAGDEIGELKLPFPAEAIGQVAEELERSMSGGAIEAESSRHLTPEASDLVATAGRRPEERLRALGEALFDALFPAPVRHRWQECLEEIAGRSERGLRLILKSDPACRETAVLHRLPWELLRDPETGAFLALSRKTTFVRQLALDDDAVLETPRPARRLRVLAVLSRPPGLEPLDLERERRTIEEAVADRPEIELTLLEDPTFGELTETLRGAPFHVLHFMGHGAFDLERQTGHLFLAGVDGRAARVPADRLAQVIRDVESLRLVVLNACETGRAAPGGERPFAGLAHALVRSGLPAVLAMQAPVPDRAAVELSRVFYRRLAAGETVDEALAEARVAVYATEEPDGHRGPGAWAVPALFVRRPELAIFQPRPESSTAADHARGRESSRRSRWRRWLPAVVLLILAAVLVALFSVHTPWAEIQLDALATRVAFTLTEPRPLIDTLPVTELAVLDVASIRHPDPVTGGERVVTADRVEAEYLGLLATAPDGAISLDEAALPAGTRVDIERFAPWGFRLSLDFTGVERPGSAGAVTASIGEGATLRLVPGPSQGVDLDSGGPLALVPRAGRIDLDVTPAAAGATEAGTFHTPLEVGSLEFVEIAVTEERGTWSTQAEQESTVRSLDAILHPLGGGEPKEVTLGEHGKLLLSGLRGEITRLRLDGESLSVAFRGRVDEVSRRTEDGRRENLMPTWNRTPWALRLGAAASALALLLGLLDHFGTFLKWSGAGRTPTEPTRRSP